MPGPAATGTGTASGGAGTGAAPHISTGTTSPRKPSLLDREDLSKSGGWTRDENGNLVAPKKQEPEKTPAGSKTPPEKAPNSQTKSQGARSGSNSRGKASGRAGRMSVGPASVPVPGTPAGILLALVLYPAGLAALRGGPSGLKNWFNAKFFNKVPGGASVNGSAWATPSATAGAPINAAYAASQAAASGAGSGAVATAYTGASGAVAPALAYALAQVGKKYVWAGAGPDGFDCSGLTMRAFQQIGVSLPHSSLVQSRMGTKVSSIADAQPGDLVFPYFPVTHVGILLPGNRVVEAANPKLGIRVTTYYGAKGGIRRVVGATGGAVNV